MSLKRYSEIINLRQKTRVASKWLNSLRDVISNTNNFLKGSGQQPLTQASFCKNVYAGSYYIDKRVRMLVPRIIDMISHMDTCQLEWENIPKNKKNQALKISENNILSAFNFTFDKLSKNINPNKQLPSTTSSFISYDMFKALVSE